LSRLAAFAYPRVNRTGVKLTHYHRDTFFRHLAPACDTGAKTCANALLMPSLRPLQYLIGIGSSFLQPFLQLLFAL
jgi:hypothetical protein